MSSSTPAVPLTPEVAQLEAELAERRAHLTTTIDELVTRLMPREILRREVEAVRIKVQALFPKHEWESFTEHFWQALQRWRAADATQAATSAGKA